MVSPKVEVRTVTSDGLWARRGVPRTTGNAFSQPTEGTHSRQAGALTRVGPPRGAAWINGSPVASPALLFALATSGPAAATEAKAQARADRAKKTAILNELVKLPAGTEQVGLRYCAMR